MKEKETYNIPSNFFGSFEIDDDIAMAETSDDRHKCLKDICTALNEALDDNYLPKIVLGQGAFLLRFSNNEHGIDYYNNAYGRLSGFRVAIDNKTPYLVADIVPPKAEFIPDEEETRVMLMSLILSCETGYDCYSLTYDAGADLLAMKVEEWGSVIRTALLESSNVFTVLDEALVYDVFVNEVKFANSDLDSETISDLSHKIIGDMMLHDAPAIEYVLAAYLERDDPSMSVVCELSYESNNSEEASPPEISFSVHEVTHCVEGRFLGITIEPVEKTITGATMVRPRPLLVLADYETGNLIQIPLGAISEYNFGSDASHDELVAALRPSIDSLEAIASELEDIDITSGD